MDHLHQQQGGLLKQDNLIFFLLLNLHCRFVHLVLQDLLVLRGPQDLLDLLGPQDLPDLLDLRGPQDLPDLQDPLDPLDCSVLDWGRDLDLDLDQD